jgi:hypothetical protein
MAGSSSIEPSWDKTVAMMIQCFMSAGSPCKAVLTEHVPVTRSLDAMAPQFFFDCRGIGHILSGITI